MAKVKKLTQKKLVDNYIKQIRAHFDDFEDSVNGLSPLTGHLVCVLDKAQNEPPLGEADGSLDEATWNQAKSVAKAVRELQLACDRYGAPSLNFDK
jgi:hypothetical protein